MHVQTFKIASDFLNVVGKSLQSDEIQFGLMLSLADRLKLNPKCFGEQPPWFLAVSEGRTLCAAFLRTPPHNLICAYFTGNTSDISKSVADVLLCQYNDIPGIVGSADLTCDFTEHWSGRRNLKIAGQMGQLIHRLDKVNKTPKPEGRFRIAESADATLIGSWSEEFHHDVFGAQNNIPIDRFERRIDSKDIFVWETTFPVSMAGKARPVGAGISIGPVYTPSKFRNHGYATACVSSLCELLLKSGYKYCSLYTDAANPTSNKIYAQIGFRSVCKSVQIAFNDSN
jgi:predicted GNAT family acetyltransferase